MANLAIVGSHSTNGVAAIHSELLRTTTVRDLAEIFPERFNNKTNGVTPRRWLLLANPALSRAITDAIGDGWIDRFRQDRRAEAARRRRRVPRCRSARPSATPRRSSPTGCKRPRARWSTPTASSTARSSASTNTSARCSMRCTSSCSTTGCARTRTSTCRRARSSSPARRRPPITLPSSSSSSSTIWPARSTATRRSADGSRSSSCPEYSVSLAERLIPAADVSNQISTAGYEASGTSNMKFMMNGALTIGTRDGATIEMAEEAGEENFFLFGLTAQQVADSRGWYNPRWHYENEPETRAALDLIASNHFSRNERGAFTPAARHAAEERRPLHASRGPDRLSGGGPGALLAVRGSRRMGPQGNPQCRGLGQVLQRPDHRAIRDGNLARKTLPGGVG